MVDISEKPEVYREAKARGYIVLKSTTIEKIRSGEVEKGDVFTTAQIAGILAAKNTPSIIPLCHPIPLTQVNVRLWIEGNRVYVESTVKTTAKTGVEMEALTATVVALLTVWDMVKKYEKDERGQYPTTVIEDVRVISKVKGEQP